MAWKIKCKMTHPRGFMRRDGVRFPTRSEIYLDKLTPGLEKEWLKFEEGIGWLIFEEIPDEEIPDPSEDDASADLDLLRVASLRKVANDMDISLPGSLRKDEIISTIRESGKEIPDLTEY